MNKKILGVVILFSALGVFAAFFFLSSSLGARLYWWDVHINLDKFSLVSFDKNEMKFSRVEKLEAKSNTMRVFISRTEIEDHKKFIDDRKFVLESLFMPSTSPYPEVITNTVECSDEFKPKIQNVADGTIYTLFAGERYNYGVCTQDLVTYSSGYGIFDCKGNGIFEVRLFSEDRSEIHQIMQSFKC